MGRVGDWIKQREDQKLLRIFGVTFDEYRLKCAAAEKSQEKLEHLERFISECSSDFVTSVIMAKVKDAVCIVSQKISYNPLQGKPCDIELYLYATEFDRYIQQGYLWAELQTDVVSGNCVADIQDIQGTPKKGYGSLMMEILIRQCRWIGVSKIQGYLSPVDEDHRERQLHFYKKFGFCQVGSNVRLELK
jgi:hypothetical protein